MLHIGPELESGQLVQRVSGYVHVDLPGSGDETAWVTVWMLELVAPLLYFKIGDLPVWKSSMVKSWATTVNAIAARHRTTAAIAASYDAYFGTYKINEQAGVVTHHLDAALWPGDIGKDIDRHFTISGDHLTNTFDTTAREGVKVTRTLMWERMK